MECYFERVENKNVKKYLREVEIVRISICGVSIKINISIDEFISFASRVITSSYMNLNRPASLISLNHVQNRGNALTRLDELKRDAIVLLKRLVETLLREVFEGMVGGFFGAGCTIILHSPGVLLLASSSFFFTGVAAVAVTHDLPPAARRLTRLALFLLALANVVRDDDSLLLMQLRLLLLLIMLLIYLLVIDGHRCVVDSQWHGLPNPIFIDTQELVRRIEDVHAQKSSL